MVSPRMVALPLWAAAVACAASPSAPRDEQDLRRATVALGSFCAGVVVGPYEVLTAAHCVRDTGASIPVRYVSGVSGFGEAVAVDRSSDLAVLRLTRRAPVQPLEIRSTPTRVGETILFTGRNDFGHPFEHAVVERFGRCPSLPDVPDAIFTSLQARHGDSGAPVVDRDFRVVGLIHGGARCHIAAPTSDASKLLAQARQVPHRARGPAAARRVGGPRTAPGQR